MFSWNFEPSAVVDDEGREKARIERRGVDG
jgi:hypothetical protein